MLDDTAKSAVETGAKAGLTLVESSVLGATAVFFAAVAAVLLWRLLAAQDMRTAEAKASGAQMLEMTVRLEGLITKMSTTFSSMENTLNNLTQAEKDGQAVLQAMKQSIDNVIRDAVVSRHRYPSESPRDR
jgi:DNA topoisomerase IA